MKILYISSFCGPKILDYIFTTAIVKPGQAVQKFHRLIIEGFCQHKELCSVSVLSAIPVTTVSHSKKWWKLDGEKLNGAQIDYISFFNFLIFKHFFVFAVTFYKVIKWRIVNRKEPQIVICDILNNGIVWSTFIACKLTRQNMLVVVTDLPEMMVGGNKKLSVKNRLFLSLSMYVLRRFDYYVILTQQMNAIVNPNGKPYLVMEGLVDENITSHNDALSKDEKRVLLYAGGIYKKYGVKDLIEAFMLLKHENIELHIYGDGDLVDDMPKYCLLDKRIKYFGVVANNIVVNKLSSATLLVNPRPTTEEFTHYSFPSKNMEYMVSGTPLLTTKLPGMPPEYNEYVYLFEDEKAIFEKLHFLLSKPTDELIDMGLKAKNFVLECKSNKIQTKKILQLVNT